jgi:hypothetical protein
MTATRPAALVTGVSSGIGKAVSAATDPKPRLRHTVGPAAGRVRTLRRAGIPGKDRQCGRRRCRLKIPPTTTFTRIQRRGRVLRPR